MVRTGITAPLLILLIALFVPGCERPGGHSSDPTFGTESHSEQEQETTTNDELLVMLETGESGPWRESAVRLAHRIDDAAEELNDRAGRSTDLDERIETVLAIALLYTLPVDELQRYSKLDLLAKPQIKRARESLEAAPPPQLGYSFPGPSLDLVEPDDRSVADRHTIMERFGGFVVPYLLEQTRSKNTQTKAIALRDLRRAVAARSLVAHLRHDHSKVKEFHGDVWSSTTISSYANNVGKNNWNEKLTFEVEDYVRVLQALTEPYDSLLINCLRSEKTLTATTWDEWWARARPLWNEWWQAKASGRARSREDLWNICHIRHGFQMTRDASQQASVRIAEPVGRIARIIVDGSVRVEGRIPIGLEESVNDLAVEVLFDDCLVWWKSLASDPFEDKEKILRVREPTSDEQRAGNVELIEVSGAWWTRANPCPPGATLHGTPVPPEPPPGHVVACKKSDRSLHGSETTWTHGGEIISEKHYLDGKMHGIQTYWQSMKSVYWLGERLDYFRRPGCT